MVSSFYACSLDERSFGFYFIFREKNTPPTTTIIFKQLKIMIVREYKKVNRINIRKKGKNYISFLILKGLFFSLYPSLIPSKFIFLFCFGEKSVSIKFLFVLISKEKSLKVQIASSFLLLSYLFLK